MIRVVLGPPCSGKSTFVAAEAKDGDVVVDYDLIAKALGSRDPHKAPKSVRETAFAARAAAIEHILQGIESDAWLIHSAPASEQMQKYVQAGAEITTIDPGIDVCLQRAHDDERPEWTAKAIERWYSANEKSGRCGNRRLTAMLTKNAAVQLKAGPEDGLAEGQFVAYASVFGNVDSYGDVVVKGAFASDLARWEKSGNAIPLLFGHNMTDPDYNIGHVVSAQEDSVGLKVTAQLDLENPKAKQVYRLLKGRRIDQMSFAYDVITGSPAQKDGEDVYEIRELKLYEVSVVTVGANQETEILAVKQMPVVADRLLTDVKAGRVLSAKNEGELRSAHEAIGRVLSVLDSTSDEQKASESGPPRQANDVDTKSDEDQVDSEESPREAIPTPSVDRSAYIDAMLGVIDAEVA